MARYGWQVLLRCVAMTAIAVGMKKILASDLKEHPPAGPTVPPIVDFGGLQWRSDLAFGLRESPLL
jgi:hypothetical protein